MSLSPSNLVNAMNLRRRDRITSYVGLSWQITYISLIRSFPDLTVWERVTSEVPIVQLDPTCAFFVVAIPSA